ncbi:MAG: rod shape-determining protein MreD [Anaerolineales bacterium]|nr:rod shape-determining protein MreD [Anaerolineales bacterium]
MAVFISIPILGALLVLQSTLIAHLNLLHGTADLVLLAIVAWALQKRVQTAWHWCLVGGLMVDIASALPMGVPLLGYTIATALALILRQRVWQVPILAMFIITFVSTIVSQGIAMLALQLIGEPIPMGQSFSLIIVPSTVLNLLFAIPTFALMGDLAKVFYPEELEV